MQYELLNDMVKYIEANLEEKIEYKKLAKIVGVSEYSLQRIFIFLTGISISEYIRKRRLSKAYEELKESNIKIIDLAIKYGYDSPISFSRAFKKYFGMTPSECRNSDKKFKIFPVMEFHKKSYKEYNYEIKKIKEKEIYCFGVNADTHDDLLFKIRELYKEIKNNGTRETFDKLGMYGICKCINNKFEYYVGCQKRLPGTKKIIIDKGLYAVFEVNTYEQKDINKVYDFVYNEWIKSTNFEVVEKPEMELYENDKCYIYIPIDEKKK